MKINIYLDDLRDCPAGFIIARTVSDALYYVRNAEIVILSLDHDLGCDANGELEPNGYDFVKVFCEEGLFVEKIYIHTDNPVGRENMHKTLLAAQKRGFISEKIKIYYYPYVDGKYSCE